MATLRYPYQFVDFPPSVTNQGTGYINYPPWLADPSSVADVSKRLVFKNPECRIVVLCLTIASPAAAPNWFGIAFRQNIKSFTSANIFFHPSPAGAGMNDNDYFKRTGNWPALFRYAQNLGFQFDPGNCDQILLIPFFNNASYRSGGIFTSNWTEILLVAVNAVYSVALWRGPTVSGKIDVTTIAQGALIDLQQGNATPIEVKDVVLSCFSYGRVPMLNFRSRANPSLDTFLREMWDFEGTGIPLPASTDKVQVIAYDQSVGTDPSRFHVPVWRWSTFPPGAPKTGAEVHGLIPQCLLWHATTVSHVGK